MKSEKEIRELFEKLKEVKAFTHPSVIMFGQWILDEGDPMENSMWLEIIDGIVDANRRNKSNVKV